MTSAVAHYYCFQTETGKVLKILLKPFLLMVFVCINGSSFGVMAQPHPMQEGLHFQSITPPINTDAAEDIIEVLDVFWYGCPVCKEFEPMMTYYGSQIKGDLVMRRMPAIWNPVMRTQAQLYYTAIELGIVEQAHPAAFGYLQDDMQPLSNAEQVHSFFSTLGITTENFERAWHSDNVALALNRAESISQSSGINRLPALVVNGRYQVIRNEGVLELTDMVIVANQLISVQRDVRRID